MRTLLPWALANAAVVAAVTAAVLLTAAGRNDRTGRGAPTCGTTLGYREYPRFVCTLEPHDGDVHANPGAIARIQGDHWTIQTGKTWDPAAEDFRLRDFMAEARRANPHTPPRTPR